MVNLVDFVLCFGAINAINCVFADSKVVDDLLATLLAFIDFNVISGVPLEVFFTEAEVFVQKMGFF